MKLKLVFLLLIGWLMIFSGCGGNGGGHGEVEAALKLKTEGAVIYLKGGTQICYLDLATGSETVTYQYSASVKEANLTWYYGKIGQIILADKINGNYDLFIYDINTKKVTELTACNSGKTDRHPSVDRLGSKLVFQSLLRSPTRVCLHLLNGSREVRFIATGENPVISPDGKKIAYISNDQLYICELNGDIPGTPTNISPPAGIAILGIDNPCWAPDSQTLAVEMQTDTDARYIYTVSKPFMDTPKWQQATFNWGKGDHRHPFWSGDGTILFYTAHTIRADHHDLCAVYWAEVQTKGSQAQWYQVTNGNKDIKEPCWAGNINE